MRRLFRAEGRATRASACVCGARPRRSSRVESERANERDVPETESAASRRREDVARRASIRRRATRRVGGVAARALRMGRSSGRTGVWHSCGSRKHPGHHRRGGRDRRHHPRLVIHHHLAQQVYRGDARDSGRRFRAGFGALVRGRRRLRGGGEVLLRPSLRDIAEELLEFRLRRGAPQAPQVSHHVLHRGCAFQRHRHSNHRLSEIKLRHAACAGATLCLRSKRAVAGSRPSRLAGGWAARSSARTSLARESDSGERRAVVTKFRRGVAERTLFSVFSQRLVISRETTTDAGVLSLGEFADPRESV